MKAFIKKNIKNRSIFSDSDHTISYDKAVEYVNEFLNSKTPKSFLAVKANLSEIERYRNNIAHYYNEQLIPYIFMLVARCALNYVDFMRQHFDKDIMADEELFIMPLGFKLPFKPEDSLSKNAPAYTSSAEAKRFIDGIMSVTTDLQEQGVEDSVVLGFNIYLESVKKMTNSDLLVAITTEEDADASFTKIVQIRFTENAEAQVFRLSDDEFRNTWKHTHADVVTWCKENIPNFLVSYKFNRIKSEIRDDTRCVYTRRLNSRDTKSQPKYFYSDFALEQIKDKYITEV